MARSARITQLTLAPGEQRALDGHFQTGTGERVVVLVRVPACDQSPLPTVTTIGQEAGRWEVVLPPDGSSDVTGLQDAAGVPWRIQLRAHPCPGPTPPEEPDPAVPELQVGVEADVVAAPHVDAPDVAAAADPVRPFDR